MSKQISFCKKDSRNKAEMYLQERDLMEKIKLLHPLGKYQFSFFLSFPNLNRIYLTFWFNIDLTRFTFQKQMILWMRLREDMGQELNQIRIQITILITSQARQHSDLVLSIQRNTQVQFIDLETLIKNSQMKEP